MPKKLIEKLKNVSIPDDLLSNRFSQDLQKEIPARAKDRRTILETEDVLKRWPTSHKLILGDSRKLLEYVDEQVHLIVTSPPYWILKPYKPIEGQLGVIEDYDKFLSELNKVWRGCFKLLVPGGRMCVVVGDVCIPRRRKGRHEIIPLHADIQINCRKIGFENLAPIIWYKITNISLEVNRGRFLGKPYEPNAIIKNDIEYILFFRKPGYRKPTELERKLSVIPEEEYKKWFQQIWRLPGESTKHHPAPYPLELAERLIRMFSFVDDVVLDPFMGRGTTNIAAMKWGRNSIGIEIDPDFFNYAVEWMKRESSSLLRNVKIEVLKTSFALKET